MKLSNIKDIYSIKFKYTTKQPPDLKCVVCSNSYNSPGVSYEKSIFLVCDDCFDIRNTLPLSSLELKNALIKIKDIGYTYKLLYDESWNIHGSKIEVVNIEL